jgi:hypothetical protein
MNIFIGSSSEAADNDILLRVAAILRKAGAVPVLWNETPSIFKAGMTTIETLEKIIEKKSINASVFIYTEDDKTWYRGYLQNVPRDNIVFEHGLFTGMLGREKAIAVKFGNVKMPSDLLGVTCVDFGRSPEDATVNIKGWVKGLLKMEQNNKIGVKKGDEPEQEITQNYEIPVASEKSLVEIISISQGVYYRLIDDKEIRINSSLHISKNVITQDVYQLIMGNNPSHFKGGSLPVEKISFIEAVTFCNRLSVRESYQEVYTINDGVIQWNETAKGYRLPFEIEWEYALGYDIREILENLSLLAWYCGNSDQKTHDVGLKKDNKYGLFDILGNVWEWCFDNYKDKPPQSMVSENGNRLRVLRGGSFADFESMFTKKNAFRKKQDESIQNRITGLRIVLQNIKMET